MLAKILGGEVGEKLTHPKSTSVGLQPTLTSALDTAQLKSSSLKPTTLQSTFTVWATGQKSHQGPAAAAFYKQANLDQTGTFPLRGRTHAPSHPIPHSTNCARTLFLPKPGNYQPHSAGLGYQPEPPSARHLWRQIHAAFPRHWGWEAADRIIKKRGTHLFPRISPS